MKIARYEKRVGAYLVDELLALLLALPLFIVLRLYLQEGASLYLHLLYWILTAYGVYVFLGAITMQLSHGSTLGMLIFGIKCYCADGNYLRVRQCWLRCLESGLLPVTIANAIYMLTMHTERSVFDRLCDNLVIDVRHGED